MTEYQCPKCQQRAVISVLVLSVTCVRCGRKMKPAKPAKAKPQVPLIQARKTDQLEALTPDDELVPF
jgi:ribosomal protein L37AE/L43A